MTRAPVGLALYKVIHSCPAAVTFIIVMQGASGVALYWATSTGVGILQSALIRRRPAATG